MTYDFEPLIDAQQVANLLGIHPKTVQQMARAGTVPGIRVGRFWRFRKSEIDRWLRCELELSCYACRQNEEIKS